MVMPNKIKITPILLKHYSNRKEIKDIYFCIKEINYFNNNAYMFIDYTKNYIKVKQINLI